MVLGVAAAILFLAFVGLGMVVLFACYVLGCLFSWIRLPFRRPGSVARDVEHALFQYDNGLGRVKPRHWAP